MITILVPLDGSLLAEHALPVARAFARAGSARIVLTFARWIANATDPHAPALESIADTLRAEGFAVSTHVRHLPSTEEAGMTLLQAAAELDAGLIVMATHGHGGLGRVLYGSVADQVVRQTTIPLVLVPPHSEGAWPADRAPRVLVPLDGSERAESVLGPLQELLGPLGAEVILLRVAETIDFTQPHGDQCDVCRAARLAGREPDIEPVRVRQYLEGVAARLKDGGLPAEIQAEVGNATSTISRVALERKADLIAMATHGRGGLQRFVMGSVATDTLRRAHVPLLLVRTLSNTDRPAAGSPSTTGEAS